MVALNRAIERFIIGVADFLGASVRFGTGLSVLSRNSSDVAVIIMPQGPEQVLVLLALEPSRTKGLDTKDKRTRVIGEFPKEDLSKPESQLRARLIAKLQEYLV